MPMSSSKIPDGGSLYLFQAQESVGQRKTLFYHVTPVMFKLYRGSDPQRYGSTLVLTSLLTDLHGQELLL